MKVLVTGGKGFIGRYLVPMMLGIGWEVDDPTHFCFDITDPIKMNKFRGRGYDAVIHLAAKLMINRHSPGDYFDVNTIGTFNVLEFCRTENIKRFVYAMTHSDTNKHTGVIHPYNSQKYGTGTWDNNAIPFIQSKVAAADMVEAYTGQGAIDGIILRLANIRGFGSSDTKYNSPFHQFIDKARKGEPIEVWGNPPKTFRDMIYVRDVCLAFIAAVLAHRMNGYFNVGSGIGMTILDEIRSILRVFGDPSHPSELIFRNDIPETRTANSLFDIEKTKKFLNWEPRYKYDQGLQDFKEVAGW